MENRQMPKLYGTLGPACRDADMLARLIQAGMTGLRINLSHGSLAGCASWLEQVRAAEARTGQAAGAADRPAGAGDPAGRLPCL